MSVRTMQEFRCELCQLTKAVEEGKHLMEWRVYQRTIDGTLYTIHLCGECVPIVKEGNPL